MDTQIILVYCLCDDLLKAMQHQEDIQCQMSDAEVMTVALVAALNHGGNFVKASAILSEQGYMPVMLSKSRFSRRLHRIKPMFLSLFAHLGEHFKAMNEESVYLIDTFPLTQRFGEKELIIAETPRDFQEIEKEVDGLRIKELSRYIDRTKQAG